MENDCFVKILFTKGENVWIFMKTILFRHLKLHVKVKVKWSRYRSGVAQRVGGGKALFFHDRGTKRGWVVSHTHRPHFTLGKDTIPIVQETRWAPEAGWTGGKSRPHRDSIPDCPSRSQSLYRLSYPAHWSYVEQVAGLYCYLLHIICCSLVIVIVIVPM